MTIETTTCRNSYTGNGVTTSFAYVFRIFNAADLIVQKSVGGVVSTLTLNTDYTVTGVGLYTGGSVVLGTALANGAFITIWRDPAQVQDTLLEDQSAYSASTVMGMVDLLTMEVQALQDQVTRCVQFPALDTTTPTSGVPGPPWPTAQTPSRELGAGQYFYLDATTLTVQFAGGPGGGGSYMPISGGTFTGPVHGITPGGSDNSTLLATTAWAVTYVGTNPGGYLTTSAAASTYLTQTTAASTYLTQSNAASTYQTKSNNGSTFNTYTSSQTVTVPAGVTVVEAEGWGGGASGLGDVGAIGGGGGAYFHAVISVSPGDVLHLTIGAGGAASTGAANNGGATTISINGGSAILTAGGGTGAVGGVASATVTYFGVNGQRGGLGVGAGAVSGYVVAGTGGDSPRGGAGGPGGFAGAATGYGGVAPGGGGGSAFPGAGQTSGAGALGAITLRW